MPCVGDDVVVSTDQGVLCVGDDVVVSTDQGVPLRVSVCSVLAMM